ncbi:hypothetical protein [Sphingomonas rubra]|uniref:Uncharacterized protein n=1 Tax=Sphingomonas rubra TaxID=634430 RepID=A0A1I5SP76_9SPHN|nr:hypothetical protein [Sphingomonas rubra]SFP72327.1 hypothetical protein SAMN04488241_10618 [Sphingomonas rubra]
MRKFDGLIVAVAATVSTGVAAQEVISWGAPIATTGAYSYFPMGTALHLTTRTELNTKQHRAGDRFYLEVAEPLIYRGQVVVPVGSVAVGEVMRAERNGHFGKRGKLDIRLLHVQTPSGPIRLTGRSSREGVGQGALSIAGGILVAWPMFFIHGTSGRVPADTSVTAYLADDLRFAIQSPTAQTARIAYPDKQEQAKILPARFDPSVFNR